MLDIKWIRENPEDLVTALKKRQWSPEDAKKAVDGLIEADELRRAHLGRLQERQERRNAASKEIGNAMRSGDAAKAEELKGEVGAIKEWLATAEDEERRLDKELEDALAVIPNVPLDDVPVGADEHANVERHRFGDDLIAKRQSGMGNKPREHFEIGEKLGMMDFERAAKLSGSRFTVLKGQLARLERALGQFMLDLHTSEHGYTEMQVPLMVRDDAMFGTGQLPKFKEDLFETSTIAKQRLLLAYQRRGQLDHIRTHLHSQIWQTNDDTGVATSLDHPNYLTIQAELEETDTLLDEIEVEIAALLKDFQRFPNGMYLIPTAEVPLTNLVREEITAFEKLPLRFTALTPCFRSEAGSAGRDTRGMLRQHQFYKVELVSITDQESSRDEHERMTQCAEAVLKKLELPFRTVTLCTGDMGFGAQKTYDIEVWLPGQNAYREISSCSVCGDFQARRMNARYRPPSTGSGQGKGTAFVHTLNGSGTAVGRALIAVMENYQNEDGSVTIPEALRPYMGGLTKIEARA
jgi:seryl-tRNA synthetase